MNNITTIQIRENTKSSLEQLKVRSNQTYEDVIINLLEEKQKNKSEQEKLLIEGYKEMAEESLKITREFQAIEGELNWEW